MTDTIVSSTETVTPPPPETTAAPAAVDAAELQRQIDDLREQVAESNRTAQFWAEQARGNTPAVPAEPGEPADPDDDDDDDVLEAITTKGGKGFDSLAAKRGFVRKAEVEQMIETRAAGVVKEQELLTRYPDLRNRTSEFFKDTARYYGQLVKSGTPATLAMELASEKTELELMRAGKLSPESNRGDTRETERLARISAQSAGGGSRRPAGDETDDNTLSEEQKRIIRGMGITEEAYLKRAKAGVRIGGKGPR